MNSFNPTWRGLLSRVLMGGQLVAPRGQLTRELAQQTIQVDMRAPVLTVAERKLSYQGAAAEAHWILSGDNKLANLEPWLPRMREFSDDGVVLAGAYGPPIHAQLDYVIDRLVRDPDTRQATLTTWVINPAPSKDIPCTVSMDFKLRLGSEFGGQPRLRLNMHVFMRSSDAWLGVPYDVFSFAMLAHLICCRLNEKGKFLSSPLGLGVSPGTLYLTAASSHLYARNWLDALHCVSDHAADDSQYLTPEAMWIDEQYLMARLEHLRSTQKGDRLRWWESGQ